MSTTWERARTAAANLLEDASVTAPPVPVERIARRLGAQLRYEPFEGDLSGLLFQETGQAIIGVNASHSKARQRFTIAHELGHLILHHQGRLHIDRNYRVHRRDEVSALGINVDEMVANAFAAELLMPAMMLERDLHAHAIDYEDDALLRRLAERYKVSLQAMIFRLTNLGYITQPIGDSG